MKRILFVFLFAFTSLISAQAQFSVDGVDIQELDIQYLTVKAYGPSVLSKFTRVLIDYGQRPTFKRQEFLDDKRREIQFYSEMDVINYMAKLGWEVHEIYREDVDSGPVNFIMQRK